MWEYRVQEYDMWEYRVQEYRQKTPSANRLRGSFQLLSTRLKCWDAYRG